MKAFLSYSVSDNNDYIITLLATKLREKKFVISTSLNFYSSVIDNNTMYAINDAHLFIGLITGTGNERNRVLEEWKYAVEQNIPNLLLIEDTVPVHQTFTGNYVRFNRMLPQPAIDEIHRRMTPAQPAKTTSSDDIVPWLWGGAALIAILGLLSNSRR